MSSIVSAIRLGNEDDAISLLNKDKSHEYSKVHPPVLYIAIRNKMVNLVTKLLKHPDRCHIGGCFAYAFKYSDVVSVKELLRYRSHYDINSVNSHGNNILMIACRASNEMAAMEILKCRSDLNIKQKNKRSKTAFLIAVERRLDKVCLELLKRPEECGLNDVCTIDNVPYIPLVHAVRLCNIDAIKSCGIYAIKLCSIDVIKKIIQHTDSDLLKYSNKISHTVMEYLFGNYNVSDELVEMVLAIPGILGTDYVNQLTGSSLINHIININTGSAAVFSKKKDRLLSVMKNILSDPKRYGISDLRSYLLIPDSDGVIPINNAILNKMNAFVDLFMENPVQSGIDHIESNGRNSLSYACQMDDTHAAMEILEHMDKKNLSHTDSIDCNALLHALDNLPDVAYKMVSEYPDQCGLELDKNLSRGMLSIACDGNHHMREKLSLELMKHTDKIDPYRSHDPHQQPLLLACKNKMSKLALEILKHPDDKGIISGDHGYNSPLFTACSNCMSEVALKLLDRCSDDCLGRRRDDDDTCLMIACDKGMESVALKMLERIDHCNIATQNTERDTALILAISNDMPSVAKKILSKIDECNLGAIDDSGNTALSLACNEGYEEIALMILQRPEACSMGSVDEDDSIALTEACKVGFGDVAMIILDHTDLYDVGMITSDNNTPLTYACKNGMEEVALKILKDIERCNLDVTNDDGCCALDFAYRNRMDGVVEILEPMSQYIQDHLTYHRTNNTQMCKGMTSEQIYNKVKNLKELEKRIDSIRTEKECIVCYEETKDFSFMMKCKHVVPLCINCSSHIESSCPLCGTDTNVISNVHVV